MPDPFRWVVRSSIEVPCRTFEAWYRGVQTLGSAGLTLRGGYKDPLGGPSELFTVVSGGVIDEVTATFEPDGQITHVKGRDSLAQVLDTSVRTQFLSPALARAPWLPVSVNRLDWTTADDAALERALPAPPPGWQRLIGSWTAHSIVVRLLGGIDAAHFELLEWLTGNYTLREPYVAKGRIIDAIRDLLKPLSLVEMLQPYIWEVRPGTSERRIKVAAYNAGGGAGWSFSVQDARLKGSVEVTETQGPAYSYWLLIGGPDLTLAGDVFVPHVRTATASSYDGEGHITSTTTSIQVTRKEDQAVTNETRFTQGLVEDPDTGEEELRDIASEVIEYKWEKAQLDPDTYVLYNRPVLLLQTRNVNTRNEEGRLRPSMRQVTTYTYDDFKVHRGAVTHSETLDPDTGESQGSTVQVETTPTLGPAEMTLRTLLTPEAEGSQSQLEGGLPAGGAGTSPIPLPLCIKVGQGGGWADIEYTNPNLTQGFLDLLDVQIQAGSGKIKREIRFTVAAFPLIERGDAFSLTGLVDAQGTPWTFSGHVVGLTLSFREDGEQSEFVQEITLRQWI